MRSMRFPSMELMLIPNTRSRRGSSQRLRWLVVSKTLTQPVDEVLGRHWLSVGTVQSGRALIMLQSPDLSQHGRKRARLLTIDRKEGALGIDSPGFDRVEDTAPASTRILRIEQPAFRPQKRNQLRARSAETLSVRVRSYLEGRRRLHMIQFQHVAQDVRQPVRPVQTQKHA